MKNKIVPIIATTALVFILMPQILNAQYERRISAKDSIALANSGAIADTGRMVLGLQNLTPYDNPTYCLRGIETALKSVWRSSERDTLPPDQDSIPTLAYEKGRECISKFTPQTVRREQLPSYLTAASILKDTALMRSIINYAIKSDSVTDYYKIRFLSSAIELGYNATNPHLTDFVPSILKQLTTFGKDAANSVATAYDVIKAHYYRSFDTANIMATANERAAYLSKFSDEELPEKKGLLEKIYMDSLALVMFRRPPDYAEQAKRLFALATEATADNPMTIMEREVRELQVSLIGKPSSDMEIVAAFPSTATAVPEKGKVTIYYRLNAGINANNTLHPMLAKLKRIHKKYGPEKLDIVLVTTAVGSMWDSPPLEPEVEAKLQNWYFRQYHDLPFTLLVNKRNVFKRRDGRLVRESPLFDDFLNGARVTGYMVGKDGTVQGWTEAFMGPEDVIGKYIERELAK